MFKNIIAPVQAWLLASGKCVGCGTPLSRGEKEKKEKGLEKVICKCGRIYMYDSKTKKYRRALFEEV
jgi:hypothetical protein